MEKIDIFKEMLIAQRDALDKFIDRARGDKSPAGVTVSMVLESEKRMVDNFILLVDLLPK